MGLEKIVPDTGTEGEPGEGDYLVSQGSLTRGGGNTLQDKADLSARSMTDTQMRAFLEQYELCGNAAIAYKRIFPTSGKAVAEYRGPLLLQSARARAIQHEMKREAPDNLDSEMVQVAVELARDRSLEPRDRLDAVKVYAALRKVGSAPAPDTGRDTGGLAAILAEIRRDNRV